MCHLPWVVNFEDHAMTNTAPKKFCRQNIETTLAWNTVVVPDREAGLSLTALLLSKRKRPGIGSTFLFIICSEAFNKTSDFKMKGFATSEEFSGHRAPC
jgi:hypothetical protein